MCIDVMCAGYGIDFAERYRWLPYVGIPKPEVVQAILAENKAKEERLRAQHEAQEAREQALHRIESANGFSISSNNGHSNGHTNGHSTAHSNSGGVVGNVLMSHVKAAVGSAAASAGLALAARPVLKK